MIELLKKFKVIIETKNVTKAAERLYISQPALTQAIQKLERLLKVKLLIRNKDGVKPTPAGRIVYDYSKRFDTEIKNLKTKIKEKSHHYNKKIKLGFIDNVSLLFTSSIYKKFLLKHPHLNLKIFVDNSTRLIDFVERGSIDFAVITKPEKKLPRDIRVEDFASEKMVLVSTVPIARQINKIGDIQKFPLISYNKESNTYGLIKSTLSKQGLKVKSKIFSASPDFILQMVRLGNGIAVLPRNIVLQDLRMNILEEIDLTGLSFIRDLSLIYLKNTYLSKTTQEFLKQLRKLYYMEPKE
jgi:DNA-binding transcriptional LysR family regulator